MLSLHFIRKRIIIYVSIYTGGEEWVAAHSFYLYSCNMCIKFKNNRKDKNMAKKNIESTVMMYLEPITLEYKYEIVDVEYVKEGSSWFLRIYNDKPGGITIDDCEKTSRALEAVLDEKDPIKTPYILEVCSPGLDRPLKKEADFKRAEGKLVDIKLYQPLNNKKEYQGELQGFKDDQVTIILNENESRSFPLKDIAIARLAIVF